ncbi:MAG TPA: autotransporter-associated beta strand repeat-containing protein [Pirellulales bacterium]|jgi:autotransporter-associated beta strand protein|nr:autotransporter-associated beta strand repeat-containing protein [Pirellulales bacterium]
MCVSHRFAVAQAAACPRRSLLGAFRILLFVLSAVGAAGSNALAGTNGTWIDATSGGLWSANANWSGGNIANGTDGIADFSTLNITADNTVHLDSARTIGQLKFGDTTPSNNWILDNNGNAADILTLAVSSGSPTITVNNDTATVNLVLAGTQGLTKIGAGDLLLDDGNTFTGAVAINAGTLALGNSGALGGTSNAVSVNIGGTLDLGGQTIGANTMNIQGAGVGSNGALVNGSTTAASYAGTITANAPFTVGGTGDLTLSGSVNTAVNVLTKIGNNTLTLSGTTDNNNLQLVVNSGTVVLGKMSNSSAHAVGSPGLTVNGGTVQLGGTGGDQIYDFAPVTVTSGTFDTNGRNETFSTLFLQGTGIGGAGALQITGFNQFSTITPTNGTVLTGNATIGVSIASALTLSNAVSGNFALTKAGPGELLLNGTNSFSGGLTVQSGGLGVSTLNNAGTNGPLGNNASVTLGSSGQTGTLFYGGGTTSSNMPFVLATAGTGAFYVETGGVNLTLNGAISGGGALLEDVGDLTLAGNNTFTGGVTILFGTLQLGNPGALNSSSPNPVAFSNGSGGSTGTLSLNGNSVTVSGLTAATGGAPVVQDANAASAVLTVNNSAANTYAGTLQDGPGGGSLGLTKSGSGTLTLGGNNTFTGGVTINAGNLQIGNPGALNSSAPNFVTFGPSSTGTLSLNGNSVAISGLFSNSGAPVIQNANNGTAATLTINNAGFNYYGGTLQDGAGSTPLSLVKNGNGLINLGGATMTFTGSVTINAGDLQIPTSNNLTGGVTINGSSILELIGGSGGISPGVVTFGPGSTGTLSVGVSGTIGGLNTNAGMVGAPVVMSSAFSSTLTINNSTSNTYAGVMQDGVSTALSLAKSGAGALTLSGNNTFTGTTTVNAGTLILGNPNALGGTAGGTIVASGATLDLGGQTVGAEPLTIMGSGVGGNGALVNGSANPASFAGTITESGPFTVGGAGDITLSGSINSAVNTLTKIGAGTLTLINQNVSNCPINVNAGTLALSGGTLTGALNNSANVVLNSGTFGGPSLANSGTFTYNGGTFNGRLINAGTAIFNADFTAGNGMENDANVSIPSGRTITLNGQGLDNEGTLTIAGGTLNLSTDASAANLNRGNINISVAVPFNLNGARLTNLGTLNVNGGLMSGTAALLTNGPGGTVSGPGTITSPFTNSGGLVAVTGGTLNITQPFPNSGAIQLSAITAALGGGAINNTGTINGFGNLGNAVTNSGTGTIEPFGGILYLGGSLFNQAGGTIRIGTGNKLLVIPGLPTNGSLINLTGGTFDNGGQPLNNLGQISGYGTFATGGTGLDNNGSITFSGGVTTVNGPVTNENGKTIVVAYNPAIFTGLVTNNGGGTFNIINTTAVFAGGSSGTFGGTFTNNANSAFSEGGSGILEADGAPTLGSASSLAVNDSSTLRFKATSGAATIGTGVTAMVNNGATLELAGSVSALSSGSSRVNITNNSSAAAGILVSGTHQQVGGIDGSGTTQVNAGSDLTANHIVQSALIIGGTAGSPGLVITDASDSSGNPLAESLQPSGPFAVGAAGFSSLDPPSAAGFSGDPIPAGPPVEGANLGGSPSAVPEPSGLLLLALGGAICLLLGRGNFSRSAVV